jgi:predicted ArsR family transcriptional regulator
MAVRQHLYALREEGLVTCEEQKRPVGRPAKLWRLTPAADSVFTDAHAELAVSLLGSMRQAFGSKGLDKLLSVRSKEQIEGYGRRMPGMAPLRRRLEALATLRSEEGYMAEVIDGVAGELLLVENHCPVCAAARACSGLCAAELAVFRAVLGPGVEIERVEHIPAGARRCAYRVAERR